MTIVMEDIEIPQSPVDSDPMELDEAVMDEVIREVEGEEPSPYEAIKERGT